MTSRHSRLSALSLVVVTAAACRTIPVNGTKAAGGAESAPPPIVQPGAPGEASHVITADKASDLSQVQYVGADIKFMQGMIGHHAQALEMVQMLKTRSANDDMKKLALRIELSQDDEIRMMQTWLQARGQQVPDRNAMHAHGRALMPGMLSA